MPEPVISEWTPGDASASALPDEWLWPTVQQLAGDVRLGVRLVVDGSAQHRGLRVAFASEMTDPSEFLRGGELVLTTGIGWGATDVRRAEAATTMVRAVARVGAAAVGFGTGPWAPDVPVPLLEAARRWEVPLLAVPISTPFLSIVEWVDAAQSRLRRVRAHRLEVGALLRHIRRGEADASVLEEVAPGWSGTQLPISAVCHTADFSGEDRRMWVEQRRAERAGELLFGERDGQLLAVGTPEALEDYRARCLDPRKVTYGVGPALGWSHLQRVLAEAWQAAEIARRRGRAAHGSDLASVEGLLMALTAEQTAPFRAHILEPLRQYDTVHGTDLVHTMTVYVESGGSLATTAQQLYLHINTVRKRLNRVEHLVGVDPADHAGFLALRVALGARGER